MLLTATVAAHILRYANRSVAGDYPAVVSNVSSQTFKGSPNRLGLVARKPSLGKPLQQLNRVGVKREIKPFHGRNARDDRARGQSAQGEDGDGAISPCKRGDACSSNNDPSSG